MTQLDISQLRRMRILASIVGYTLLFFYLLSVLPDNLVPEEFSDLYCFVGSGLCFLAFGVGISQVILLHGQKGCIHNKCWAWFLVFCGLMHMVFRLAYGIVNFLTFAK